MLLVITCLLHLEKECNSLKKTWLLGLVSLSVMHSPACAHKDTARYLNNVLLMRQ